MVDFRYRRGWISVALATASLCGGLACRSQRVVDNNPEPSSASAADSPAPPTPVDASVAATPRDAQFARDAAQPSFAVGPADEFVDLAKLDPTIEFDLRYATTNNFTKTVIYPVARCLLRRAVANAVVRAHKNLRGDGYGLKIWDCYRPFSVQEKFWEQVPDPRYVAKPVRSDAALVSGSKHNRGAAIDVTLFGPDGELKMPTDHDDFSKRAHRKAPTSSAVRENVTRLTEALVAEGFTTIKTEWWHFDGADWRAFPLADEPL